MSVADPIAPLRDFVIAMTRLVGQTSEEPELLAQGKSLLQRLIANDDWLPDFCAVPHPQHYQQYVLHVDPLERFSVVSFVWGPGQRTPVHDHTTWGLIGMLRGAESSRRYERNADGGVVARGEAETLHPGEVEAVSPRIGDIHQVSNAVPDAASISIHVYGANIGAVRRHTYDLASSTAKDFVSGYSADRMPNLWDRSAAVRAGIA